MTFRKLLLLAVAVSGFSGMAAGEAAAERPFFLLRPFLPGYNDSYPPPDDVYYMTEDEYYRYLRRQRRKQRILDEYYARQDEDDYAYEEEYQPPRKLRPKKQAVKPQAKKPAAKAASKSKPVPAKKTVAAAKPKDAPSAAKPTAPAGETTASINKAASGSISCNKAADIVAGYGFDSVKAGSCNGSVYSFNARRAGKSYVVKVSSASGELTEVRKL